MVEELKARIEGLPPELYSQIRLEVLKCDHPEPEFDCIQFVYIKAT
jgi:hypothetical protein